ncbi:hypothetical protein CFC21_063361 [Triticum aestivum]|uniref:Uncharacterized protein n=3 Tax=Triticinae TaxID=1648030 RepID=A0A453J1Y1_AEGTS|nr:uncharacterized protein LOC109741480 [Aegilops tauschii subsp. strangulata]XP_044376853.1 uncharacterized protein LOC123098838 [Triticum aestivum]KAF7055882.1 hypothetical protein CFC21_063361 [Triticum aestivum]
MATTPARPSQSGGGEAVSVQHVAKASSDELLRKFADPDDDDAKQRQLTPPRRSLALRRKRSSRRVASGLSARDSGTASGAGLELAAPKRRRSIGGSTDWRAGLLLPTTTASSSSSARKTGGPARAKRGARLDEAGVAHFLAALERTWKKTVAGASRMFVERHRSSHVQLISDMV